MFKYYNPEKYKNIANTCIPKALSVISLDNDDINYLKNNWRNILLTNGFEYINIPAKPFKKRMTVAELAKNNNPDVTIVCSTADHVVCIIGNTYFDSYDSGNRCVFYYFRKEKS